MCAASIGKLNQCGAHPSRCSRHQYGIASGHRTPVQHVLGGYIRAGKGCQLGIRHRRLNGMNLTMGNFGVLGIASIAFTAEVARLGLIQWIIPVTQPTVDHHPFAEQ